MNERVIIDAALAQVPGRLRRAREKRSVTLAELSRRTGISASTLSRLESGQRKATLELLLPIAVKLDVPLSELVQAPTVQDPRVQLPEIRDRGRVVLPLTRQELEPRAYKLTIPKTENLPHLRSHAGYEWLYVLSGRMRVLLGPHDLVLGPGEVAEFACEVPHWFGSTGQGPVEALSLFGSEGEMMHVRAHTRISPPPLTPALPTEPRCGQGSPQG
ncbi:helix-turn-helix domain-containing protein [Leucobacter sp. M11]|uniref:helix-turn-helix domain-containing protein n=1 Tax=Leucobacter sp. M11 TaxID=2993565 RepID=UPI002D7F6F5A|nr:XRE family transcriptional regulator [Leucobacter sp. M11]MEB4616403.1 XRE family transcriptional regulator [Leucobacter sp. M11]